MATKTISIEMDVYDLLVRERREPNESFSRVIRRLFAERQTLTAGELSLSASSLLVSESSGSPEPSRGAPR